MDDRWNTMLELVVHPRVSARHPQLSDEDVRVAWQNSFFQALRTGSKNSPEYLQLFYSYVDSLITSSVSSKSDFISP